MIMAKPQAMAMGVMEDSPVRATANLLPRTTVSRAMEDTTKAQRAAPLLIIREDTAPTMDSPSQEDMDLKPLLKATVSPVSRIALVATVTPVSLHQLKAEATASSPLILAITSLLLHLPLVAIAAALSRLATVSSSSRVEVGMEAVVVSLEDMEAVEARAVDSEVAEANTSPLSLEEGLTAHLQTTAPLHHKAMGNKVSTDREVTTKIAHQ